MIDVDLDNIFGELEDPDASEVKFMGHLATVLPSAYFELHTEDGRVFSSKGQDRGRPLIPEALLALIRQGGRLPEDPALADACPVVPVTVDELHAVLICWLPTEMAGCAAGPFVREMIRAAVGQVRVSIAADELRIENEQLAKQIGVLKTRHFEMMEDNHRQYILIQEKDRNYAENLETEIAQRTVELREVNEELKAASRLKSEFLANMSHELRTPMNAIIGFSSLLCESGLTPEQADYARTIKQSGDGLLCLINDILDFSKIEAGKLDIASEPFRLAEIIKNVAAMFLNLAKEKGVAFGYAIGEEVPKELIGDGHRLKQVLINLAGNAMKFTQAGEVMVRVEVIRVQGTPRLRFLVSDTGIGIPRDKQASIFEKFTQADGSITRNYGGTGLGLAITAQLIGLMGGSITLCSEVGQGSTFSFTLPLQGEREGDMAQPSANVAAPPALAGPGLRILVVEDNLVNQKLASALIKREGCEVAVAGDGVQALEALKEGGFDLVLMDLQMPNMDGLEATRRIRALEAGDGKEAYQGLGGRSMPIPIIGLSAHARKEDADEAKAVGMDDFLTKPIVRAKLVEVISALRRGNKG